MDIFSDDKTLTKLCSDHKAATKRLGVDGANGLKKRLAEISAARCVGDLIAGKPHPLKRDRKGCFAVTTSGGQRLVFEPADEPPKTESGDIDWPAVTSVRVVHIGDYHDD